MISEQEVQEVQEHGDLTELSQGGVSIVEA